MKTTGAKEAPSSGAAKDPDAAAGKPPAQPPAEPTEPLRQRVKALEDERDRLKREVEDVRDKFLRARADYENLARRSSRESFDSTRAAKGGLLLRMATLAETLERSVNDGDKANPAAAKGVRLVLDDLRKLLKEHGLKEIEAVGQPFNYKYHQAVERIETAETPEGVIVELVQRGYLIEGEILRPALVKVAVPPRKAPSKEETAGTA